MTPVRARVAVAAGLCLLLGLSGCGGGDKGFATVSADGPQHFDVYLLGQECDEKGDDRSTENEYDKRVELGLVIVTGAAALRGIGTIGYLRFETGSWVRGLPVDCGKPYLCTSKDLSELGD